MFIGHYAVGLAAKRVAPRTSLGALIAAPVLLDLLWPIFVLTDLEQVRIDPGNTRFTPLDFVSYPISHSLVAAIAWATLFAVFYFIYSRYQAGAVLIWIGVVSHWLLDVVTHGPDMPLYAGGPQLGLGLWNRPAATIAVEAAMYTEGVLIYARVTRAKDGIGRWAFWSFVTALGLFYVANVFTPPPPSVKLLAIGAFALTSLLILWAWWFDRHREVK